MIRAPAAAVLAVQKPGTKGGFGSISDFPEVAYQYLCAIVLDIHEV